MNENFEDNTVLRKKIDQHVDQNKVVKNETHT